MSTDCAEVLSAAPDRRAQHKSGRLPAIARAQAESPMSAVPSFSQRADGFFLERFNERGTFVALRGTTGWTMRCARLTRNTARSPNGDFVRMMLIHWNTSGGDLDFARSAWSSLLSALNHRFAESRAGNPMAEISVLCGRAEQQRCRRQNRSCMRVWIGNSGDQPNARTCAASLRLHRVGRRAEYPFPCDLRRETISLEAIRHPSGVRRTTGERGPTRALSAPIRC